MNKSKRYNDSLSLLLKDGRQLGFAEYGDPNGKPVFFFHGIGGGSRLDARHIHGAALLNHYRLISIDRPGIGLSSVNKRHSILLWVNDIEEFADLLNIKKFAIIGHSGGALFVAACAYKIPDRLTGMAIVSGIAPLEIPEATASLSRGQWFFNKAINSIPWIANIMMKAAFIIFKNPRMLKYMMDKQMPEVDQLALCSRESHEELSLALMETFRHGIIGATQEFQLAVKPCEFNIKDIKLDFAVAIWQGGLDKQAPKVHANLYTKYIPNAELHFFEHEGHISLLINRGEEILRSIENTTSMS